MINSANKSTISAIFPPDTPIKYVIPKYQREYTWSKENWDDLIDDVNDSDLGHFIGSIICIYKGYNSESQLTYEIIDGQQRLTTVSILYSAIYKTLSNLIDSDNEELKNDLWNLKNRIIQKNNKYSTKLELSTQNYNYSDYKSILNDCGVMVYEEYISNKGNRKIYKSYRHFLSRLEKFSQEELLSLLDKINNVTLVRIEVNSASDAFMLFESLNNRGVPLSAIDLIKNKLLSEIEFSGKSIDEAFDRWKRFINNLDDFTIQERFLRQYYNSFKYKPSVKIDNITKATKSNLIDIYEKLIDRNLEFIFKDLEDKAKIYSRLINYENDDFYNELRGIDNVKAAPSYTFLLYLFSLNTDQTLLRSVINNLVKYFVRRNITDYPGTRNLDQIFIDLIELLSEDPSRINNEYISNYLFNPIRFSSLDTFKSKLEGNIYEINNDAARFLLTNIEERYSGTRERNIDFWERDKNGKLIWTIEHIFPEGSNIPTSWVNMIAGGDVEKAKEMQQKLVHKLGNLTLSGFNTNLSNSDFIKKRDLVDSSGRYIGYKNGLFLNKSLKEAEFWTEEGIIKRTSDLIEKIIEMYSIPNEK